MLTNNDADAEVVFEYTGKGCVVPEDVTIVRFYPSVIEVEYEAFKGYNNLRKVVFHKGLKKIGLGAFWACTSLTSITLPSTVTEIDYAVFYNCSSLREVTFNDGLQNIGRSAFFGCTSLSSITFPSTVTEIRNCAFSGCTSLSSITLPSTIIEIELGAFFDCNNLREVVLFGVPREIGKNAFSSCASLERFTFPTVSSRLDNLIQTGHWEEIENEVDEVRGVVARRGGELFVSAQAMGEGRNWNAVRRDIDKIIRLISYYELKEATSIFELALWKFKLDQVDKANPIPRKKCRMDVPGPVKDIILQYLSNECLLPMPDIQSSSSESDDYEDYDHYGDDYESSDDDDDDYYYY